jgi:hypothetical protein
MLNYQTVPFRPAAQAQAPYRPAMGQSGLPVTVPPFGLPPVTSGIILTMSGLVSGAVGTYMVVKGTKAIGKKLPTFWRWYYGTGGIGITMVMLGALPLVALGILEIAGGIIIQKKLEEIGVTLQQGLQQQAPK